MTETETETSMGGVAERARAFQSSIAGHVGAVTESGKAAIARRRADRRRAELLQELGELHVNASESGELDQVLADRLVSEISAIDASDESSDDDDER